MKKIYSAPRTEVLRVQTEQMVAASLGIDHTPHDGIGGDVKGGDWSDIFGNDGGNTSDSPFED